MNDEDPVNPQLEQEPATVPVNTASPEARWRDLAELEEEIRRRLRSNQRFLDRFLDEDFVDDESDEDDEPGDGEEAL